MKKSMVKVAVVVLLVLNSLEMNAMYTSGALRRAGVYRPTGARLYRPLPASEAREVDRTTVFTEVPNEPVVVEQPVRPSFWQRWFGGASAPAVESVTPYQSSRMVRRPVTRLEQAKEDLAQAKYNASVFGGGESGVKAAQLEVELAKEPRRVSPSDVPRLQNASYDLANKIDEMRQVVRDNPELAPQLREMDLQKQIIDERLASAAATTTRAVVPVGPVVEVPVQAPTTFSQRWQNLRSSLLGPIPPVQQSEVYRAARVVRGPKGGLTKASKEDLKRQEQDLKNSIELQNENEKYLRENLPADYKMKSAEMRADKELAQNQLNLVRAQLSTKKPTDAKVSELEEKAALEAPRLREMRRTAEVVRGRMPSDEYRTFLKGLQALEVAQETRLEEISKGSKYKSSRE